MGEAWPSRPPDLDGGEGDECEQRDDGGRACEVIRL
jgi:hypothetical protein